jgi:hypothetical protein
MEECVGRDWRRVAEWTGAIFVAVGEDFFFGREVVRVDVGQDVYTVGVFDCELRIASASGVTKNRKRYLRARI